MGALYANQSASDKSLVNRCQATTKAISFWTQGSVADICGVLVTLVIRCVPDKVWTACTFLGVVHGLLLARQTHRDAREPGWGPLHTFPTVAIHFTRNLFLCSGSCCAAGPFIHGAGGWLQLATGLQIANFGFLNFGFPNPNFWFSNPKFGFPNPNSIYTWREGGCNWRSSWQRKATEFTVDILADKHFLAATLHFKLSILDQTPQRVDQVKFANFLLLKTCPVLIALVFPWLYVRIPISVFTWT